MVGDRTWIAHCEGIGSFVGKQACFGPWSMYTSQQCLPTAIESRSWKAVLALGWKHGSGMEYLVLRGSGDFGYLNTTHVENNQPECA